MFKRFIGILLILCMATSTMAQTAYAANGLPASAGIPSAVPFTDVSESDWFFGAVSYSLARGIFSGTDADTFSPAGSMSRGMYVTVMGRIAGVDPTRYRGTGGFTDVPSNAYYAPYVAWAVESGITSGVGGRRFQPSGIVTREQMAVFTVRYMEAQHIPFPAYTAATTEPGDAASVSNWALDAVLQLWRSGLLRGDSHGNVHPDRIATRAEGATFCMRLDGVVETARTEAARIAAATSAGAITPSYATVYRKISFETNGGSAVSAMNVPSGSRLSALPSPKKDNAVFLGWYPDPGFQGEKFTEDTYVSADLTLYAKYLVIDAPALAELDASFALADQETNLVMTIVSSDSVMTADEVKAGLTVEAIGGTTAVTPVVTGALGTFSLSAAGGYAQGGTYAITFTDARLGFSGKADAVRSCSLTIKRTESFDIAMDDGIVYIPDTDVTNRVKNGVSVASLSVPLVELADDGAAMADASAGTFTYGGNKVLKVGDTLCIYTGTKPVPGADAALLDEDIAYVGVTAVNGTTISYADADSEDVVFLPDMLPVRVASLTGYTVNETTGSFTASMALLDFGQYADMGLEAGTTVDKGDYLALYASADLASATENDVVYGEVTSAVTNGDAVIVTFARTTASAMQSAPGYNDNQDVSGDTLLEDVDIAALQADIEQQLMESGFAGEAARYMTALAVTTDGFRQVAGDGDAWRIDAGLMPEEMALARADLVPMGAGPEIEDLKVKATIGSNTRKLGSGVRCAVEVSFTVPVDTGDNNAVEIGMTVSFVEELKLSVNASGDEVWKKKWIFPYIADYKMSAKIDVYTFTGISFKSTVTSASDTQAIDISQEMQDILATTKTADIKAGVQDLFETYSDLMKNETDWITLFSRNIVENKMSLLLGVIQVKISADFVVSANINVALGCNFEYMSGTRYLFWARLKAKEADSETIDLMDETYNFQFYCLGSLGLRAGISLEFAVGLFSVDLNSIGLTAEAGVYAKLFGYFFYELQSTAGVRKTSMSGALYMELGIYLEIAFKAQVLDGKFQYNPTLYENEWPLLSAGDRYNIYDFAYGDAAAIRLKDAVRTYTLPDSTFNMTYLDLREGDIATKAYTSDKYGITFSNSRFSLDGNRIVVSVPSGSHVVEGDMTVLWKGSSLAFSSVPISRTYHLVWDDLATGGYTISFNSNGGTAVGSITKAYGAAVSAPTAPTKTGYVFAGWYADSQLTNAYVFSTMGWSNITLHAKWTAKTDTGYKVRHYQQDVAGSGSYVLVETQSLTGTTGATVTPAVRNYAGFTAPAGQTATIAADGSLIVNYQYARNSYTLTFQPENGSSAIVRLLKFGAAIVAPALTRTGYSFTGWNAAIAASMPAANVTYTASWTAGTYAVAFDANGGTAADGITVTFGAAYGALPVPTKTGYVFNGWYSAESDDNGMGVLVTAQSTVSVASAQTLHASWVPATNTAYVVRHYRQNIADDGYSLFETNNLTGTTNAEVTPAVRNDAGFTAPATQTVTILANGSTVVDYNYARNSYQLTFDANGGTGGTSQLIRYGASLSAPVVTKPAAIFAGWSPAVAATMPAADTTYVAQWAVPTSVGTLAALTTALADAGVSEIIVTQTIPLPNGTVLNGLGKTVRAQTTGLDAAGALQSGSAYSLFTVANGSTVSLGNLTVKGGSASAITNAGTLTMTNVVIAQSGSATVSGGGGFRNTGKALLQQCVLSLNAAAYGGGFVNAGASAVMTLDGCSVTDNRSLGIGSGGGGCENSGGAQLYLINSTFSRNRGSEIGGAINNYNGTVYVLHSTITGNLVDTSAGFVCGGGIGNNGGTVRVVNSLLANNYEKHTGYEAKPSDIGVFSNGAGIYLYNAYCGAYVTSIVGGLATTGAPANSADTTVNPAGAGLTGLFSSYGTWNGLSMPVPVAQADGTHAVPLTDGSAALTGGTDVFLAYTASGVTAIAYGGVPTYLVGTTGGTKVTLFQGGAARVAGVIGAVGVP